MAFEDELSDPGTWVPFILSDPAILSACDFRQGPAFHHSTLGLGKAHREEEANGGRETHKFTSEKPKTEEFGEGEEEP